MQKILVLGAGLSSSYLIKYLLETAPEHHWTISVADANILQARAKINNHPNGTALELDAADGTKRAACIAGHDLIISMLPATMHIVVAKDCITHKKHLVTASYLSEEMIKSG
jgi:saccharopine dehydrogenase-like NADP-dependent oxidoreductase